MHVEVLDSTAFRQSRCGACRTYYAGSGPHYAVRDAAGEYVGLLCWNCAALNAADLAAQFQETAWFWRDYAAGLDRLVDEGVIPLGVEERAALNRNAKMP